MSPLPDLPADHLCSLSLYGGLNLQSDMLFACLPVKHKVHLFTCLSLLSQDFFAVMFWLIFYKEKER